KVLEQIWFRSYIQQECVCVRACVCVCAHAGIHSLFKTFLISPQPVHSVWPVEEEESMDLDSSTVLSVKVKDEPMDEEYDQALVPQDPTGKVKDEPDMSEECGQRSEDEFKISAVFTVSTSAKASSNSSASGLTPASSLCVVCSGCKKVLLKGQTAFQRKGSPQLFCSPQCLCSTATDLVVKPALKKSCHYCLKEIPNPKDVIIAPVDSAGAMKDFCSQKCLSAFNYKRDSANSALSADHNGTKCSICQKACPTRHEVNYLGSVHKLCSDACFNQFRASNKLTMNCCVHCGGYCYGGDGQCPTLVIDGAVKKFCSQNCVTAFKKKYGKPVPCTVCRGYHAMVDMVESPNSEGSRELFCSSACVTAYKVQTVSSSGVAVECNNCKLIQVPQYHLAMSDGTIRNFCSFSCVVSFQDSFNKTNSQNQLNVASPSLSTTLSQSASKPASTKPFSAEPSSSGALQIPAVTKIPCAQCQRAFFRKPELLDFKGKMYAFCDKGCIDEFRRTNYIMAQCVYCKIDKVVKEIKRINNIDCSFCSEGCKLLYKHDLAKRWGKKHCRNCLYCNSTSQTLVVGLFSGKQEEFCGNECLSQYTLLFCQVAKCSTCKRAKKMVESVKWLGEMKHFCSLQCLMYFCSLQGNPTATVQAIKPAVAQPVVAQPATSLVTKEATPVIANVISLSNTTSGQPNVLGSTALQGNFPPFISASTQTDGVKQAAAPPPRILKNKALLCKPMSLNKGTSCKPNTYKTLPEVVVLPLPVPVYVPVPMHLYTQYTAHAVGLPLPVPVPMFLPTTLDSAERIVETIQKIKEKIPDNPLEADLIMMAEMVAEDSENKTASQGGEQSEEPYVAYVMISDVHYILLEQRTQKEKTSTSRQRPRRRGRDGFPQKKRMEKSWSLSHFTVLSFSFLCLTEPARNMMLKEDLLQCSTAELSYGLCKFISEVRRPNGEMYSPDSIHYLCLGIQQHLFENGRMENIFADLFYTKFSQSITNILKDWSPTILPSGYVHSRVEEEYLWECKQLGAFSPSVLLNTLLYFCTKFFNFKTVAQHRRLSFAHVMRCTRSHNSGKVACLRFYPPVPKENGVPAKRKREDDDDDEGVVMEMQENAENPLRCPVRLYEFYLSKCSSSVKQRTNVFYLRPERSCVPNSPLWFSSMALDDEELETMLTRILTVRELYLEREKPTSVSDSDVASDSD
uniref:TRASH domain-containing protein n=1 Tax=Pygocentrus nattereri TaxID=42514 RepID=A0A3B4DTE6_PYGNA